MAEWPVEIDDVAVAAAALVRKLVELGEIAPVSAGIVRLGSGRDIDVTMPQAALIRSYGVTSTPAPALAARVLALGRTMAKRHQEDPYSGGFARGYRAALADTINMLEGRGDG